MFQDLLTPVNDFTFKKHYRLEIWENFEHKVKIEQEMLQQYLCIIDGMAEDPVFPSRHQAIKYAKDILGLDSCPLTKETPSDYTASSKVSWWSPMIIKGSSGNWKISFPWLYLKESPKIIQDFAYYLKDEVFQTRKQALKYVHMWLSKNLYLLHQEVPGNYALLHYRRNQGTITIGEMEKYWWLDFLKPDIELQEVFKETNFSC